ncbi:FadR/GntR family transcriptional regulator [Mycolicibacterium komossense]|uniref:FadR family transcriptional regulator n=1 Tax=Mycolicibacterium komossense TaxID=1779 RepID=A0ABT3CIA9_9MYCO|nr:FCD domain-containing protein [Mycolicibacterium komossense]MCV7229068.1 FadR family transcriptional regulator [Mycolicibacterium komossense]
MPKPAAAVGDLAQQGDESGRNPFEEALGQVVSRIRNGDLQAGMRLPPERELSEELQISRTTLRAVIRALQQAGYVRTQRGRSGGSTVIWDRTTQDGSHRRLSDQMRDRLLDSLRFRSVLEPGAAALAAERGLSAAQRKALELRLAEATTRGPNFRVADAELHGYIAELSDCRALVDAIANVQLILNENLLQVVPFMGPALEHSHEQHAQIVAAICAGDPNRARQVMQDHVGATAELLRTFLQ